MSDDELEYYQHRAEVEIELAQQPSDERAVQAHYEIASAYLDRVHGDAPKAPPGPLVPKPDGCEPAAPAGIKPSE